MTVSLPCYRFPASGFSLGRSSSVQFRHSVVSDSLGPHGLQAFLSITNSQSLLKLMSIELVMPSTIFSCVAPFSSCRQSFPASGSFPMCQLFPSGGQRTGASASASVFPMNTQDWSPLVMYFIHIYFIPLSPLGIQTFVLYVCVSATVLQISSSISFSRFHM